MKKKSKKFKEKETKNNSINTRKENNFINYLKSRPFFLGFIIILIIISISLFFSSRQSFDENLLSLTYGKILHEEHLSGFDYHLSQIEKQLDGVYETTLEDDYFYSFKEDILWLKEREAQIYKTSRTNLFVKELALNMAFEGILIVNENSVYDYYIKDYDTRINLALEEKYAPQDFKNNYEIIETFIGEEEKFKIFLNEYNSIMQDYFDYKIFTIKNSSSVERKFVEANKIFILSDPLALS